MDPIIVLMVQTHSMPLAAAYRSTALHFFFLFDVGHFSFSFFQFMYTELPILFLQVAMYT